MQPDERRRALLETAQAVAPGWERRREFIRSATRPVAAWMVRELAPRPGQRILELAAGPGDVGFDAAELIGPQGRLLSTDGAPAMVEVARRRAAERGVDNVEFRVMDGERIELPHGSCDGVLCRFGYMLMPDPAAALAEARRVLRDGGRLAMAVWGAPERNPWLTTGLRAMVERGHLPPPDPDAPSPFAMADEDRTRSMLTGAGFGDVRAEEIEVVWRYADAPEYVAVMRDTGFPIAQAMKDLPDAEVRALTYRIAQALEPFAAAGGGYEVPGVALGAVAAGPAGPAMPSSR